VKKVENQEFAIPDSTPVVIDEIENLEKQGGLKEKLKSSVFKPE